MNVRRLSLLAFATLLGSLFGDLLPMCCVCDRTRSAHAECCNEEQAALVLSCCASSETADAEGSLIAPRPAPSVGAPAAAASPAPDEPALAVRPAPSPLDPPLFRDDGLYTLLSVYLI
jgi:hypothetical protein